MERFGRTTRAVTHKESSELPRSLPRVNFNRQVGWQSSQVKG